MLLSSRERVAHVGFKTVGTPVSREAVCTHVFGVGLGGGVVVEGYFV